MKLGLVTYQIGYDWDVPALIANCVAAGFEGVEARSTHAHGIELELNATERAEIRKQFDDSPVALYGLGSACEYHSAEPARVEENVEQTRRFLQLAADVGAEGVKVRPNGVRDDAPLEQSLEQIGKAFGTVAATAADLGVEVWMEVHGKITSDPVHMPAILAAADHPNARVTWNCNAQDKAEDGTITEKFNRIADSVSVVHIHDLYDEKDYSWSELFGLLKARNFTGWTGLEGPGNSDGLRVMKYYRTAWGKYAK